MLTRLRQSIAGAVSNAFTGIGTDEDSGRNFSFNSSFAGFSEDEIISCYTGSGIIQKIIDSIPETASRFYLADDEDNIIPENKEIQKYLKSNKLINLFCECSKTARLFKESYIVLNIEDGLDSSNPVNGEVASLNNFYFVDNSQIDFDVDNFQNRTMYYLKTEDKEKIPIHPDRMLLFVGKYANPKIRQANNDMHMSIIDGVLSNFGLLENSVNISSSLLARFATFVVKIKGLRGRASVLDNDIANQNTSNNFAVVSPQTIINRLRVLKKGIGGAGGIAVDSDTEDVDWLTANLSGVTDIIRYHERYFTAQTEYTHDILWNEGSNNTASELESENWEEKINDFLRIHWLENLEKILNLTEFQGIAFKLKYKKTNRESADEDEEIEE
ncbi:MAG: phage portal protein [Cyanobacteria bacterium P01_A01_bin.80]